MTKAQQWNKAQEILASLGLSKAKNEAAMVAFRDLLEPKKSGGSRPEPIILNDETFYFCRFTNRYWKSEAMVYQNDEHRAAMKDKGYSAIGISLWNKGQKYLKDLKIQSVEIAYGEDQSDEARAKGMELHQQAQKLTTDNSMNSAIYLVENFITDEQKVLLESDSISE